MSKFEISQEDIKTTIVTLVKLLGNAQQDGLDTVKLNMSIPNGRELTIIAAYFIENEGGFDDE